MADIVTNVLQRINCLSLPFSRESGTVLDKKVPRNVRPAAANSILSFGGRQIGILTLSILCPRRDDDRRSCGSQAIHLAATLAKASTVTAEAHGAGLAAVGTKALPTGGAQVEMIRPRNQHPPAPFADARPKSGAGAAQLRPATPVAERRIEAANRLVRVPVRVQSQAALGGGGFHGRELLRVVRCRDVLVRVLRALDLRNRITCGTAWRFCAGTVRGVALEYQYRRAAALGEPIRLAGRSKSHFRQNSSSAAIGRTTGSTFRRTSSSRRTGTSTSIASVQHTPSRRLATPS